MFLPSTYAKPTVNATPAEIAQAKSMNGKGWWERNPAGQTGAPLGGPAAAVQPGQAAYNGPAPAVGAQAPGQSPVDWNALQQLTDAGLDKTAIERLAANTAGQPVSSGTAGFMTTNPTMQTGAPQYGLSGAEDALKKGLAGGIAGIEAGVNQAGQTLSPYTSAGSGANNLQAALSGALGPEAQKEAFANYTASPEVAYQTEMGEKAIMRNAAATGQRGGGNVLQELQRHAIGLAQQDYGNSFNRLGTLSDRGQQSSNILGGIQAQGGMQAGDMAYGTGGQMANYRTRAGEQIAGNVQDTSSSLSNLINQQGSDLSDIVGAAGGNIANLLANYGGADAQTLQSLAAILSNLSTGSGSQVAGLPGLPGTNDTGILKDLGDFIGGVSKLGKPAQPA